MADLRKLSLHVSKFVSSYESGGILHAKFFLLVVMLTYVVTKEDKAYVTFTLGQKQHRTSAVGDHEAAFVWGSQESSCSW